MVAAAGEAAEELAELRQRELRDQWAPLLRSPLEDVDATQRIDVPPAPPLERPAEDLLVDTGWWDP